MNITYNEIMGIGPIQSGDSYYQQLQSELQNDVDQVNADFKELEKYKTWDRIKGKDE